MAIYVARRRTGSGVTDFGESSAAERGVLLAASSLTVMAGAVLAPALPPLADAFRDIVHIDLLSRLVLTIPALAIAIAAPFAGMLLDRFGRRNVLLASLVFYAAAGTTGLYLEDVYLILVGRFLLGIAVAGSMTAATTIIGDRFVGARRVRFLGLQAASMAAGGVVFVLGGGLLADVHWRAPFAVYGVAVFVALVGFWSVKESDPRSETAETSEAAVPWGLVSILSLLGIAGMVLMYLIPTQLPFHLEQTMSASGTQVGLAIATMTGTSVIRSLASSRVIDRLGRRGTLATTFGFPAVGFLLLPMFQSFGGVMLAACLIGAGLGMLLPSISTWVTEIAPPSLRGRLIGVVTMCFFVGQFVSPLVAALVRGEAPGLASVFFFAAGLSAVLTCVVGGWAVGFRLGPKPVFRS
ncbi:MAG: MFS transporter [Myxococcota bacterium]